MTSSRVSNDGQVSEGRDQVPPVLFVGNKKDLSDKDPDSKQVDITAAAG
jgi:hypothetical protein